jgi:hypothetical protein
MSPWPRGRATFYRRIVELKKARKSEMARVADGGESDNEISGLTIDSETETAKGGLRIPKLASEAL